MTASAKKLSIYWLILLVSVAALGAADFEVTPDTISFTAYEAGENPDPDVIYINNHSDNAVNWKIVDVNEMTLSLPDWLSLSPTSGTQDPNSQQDVLISVDVTNLAAGTYQYAFDILSETPIPRQKVTVSLDVIGPILEVSDTSFSSTVYKTGDNPADSIIMVKNSGGGTLNWQVVDVNEVSLSLPEWLSINPVNGMLDLNQSEIVTLSYQTAGLTGGNYQYQFDITATDASNSPQAVTVNLNVVDPNLQVSANVFDIAAFEDGENPVDSTFVVKNSSGGTLEWFVADVNNVSLSLPEWLSINPVNGILDPNQSESVTLSYQTAGLTGGNYQYQFDMIAPGAQHSPQTVAVNLEVIGPILGISKDNVNFYAVESGANPEEQTFTVRNDGGGTLNWSANLNGKPDWLNVSPASGSLLQDQRDTVTVSVDVNEVPAGYYPYSFDISAPNTSGSPETMKIELIVDYKKYDWSTNPGTGSAEDPYQIWTPQQMNAIGDTPDIWDKHFKLMADIDMSIYAGPQYNVIGTDSYHNPFNGTFDGNGYTISNLTYSNDSISPYSYIGLFGVINNATIKNVTLENVSFSAACGVGGLVGLNYGIIQNCRLVGSISGKRYVGGLSGLNYGNVQNCRVTGSVTGEGRVGGLSGWNSGTIQNCRVMGSITGSDRVGGLIGLNDNWGRPLGTSVTKCSADCNIVVKSSSSSYDCYAGGLIGQNFYSGDILFCDAAGTIIDQAASQGRNLYAGGLIGYNEFYKANSKISFCHFDGNVNFTGVYSNTYIGGIVGQNGSSGEWHDKSGGTIRHCRVSGKIAGLNNVGGIVGYQVNASLRDCQSSCIVNGENNVGGLAGYMKNGKIIYCNANGSVKGDESIGGLAGRIDHHIYVEKSYANSSVDGNTNVGGLAGYVGDVCTFLNCYSLGAVTGDVSDVGGLIGNFNNSTIENSYAAGPVGGIATNKGGFIGLNAGTLTSCFWDMDVSGLAVGVGSGDSTGVFGQTTGTMQTPSTFTSAGWDFYNDDGNPAAWKILSGDYPRLTWQPAGTASYSGGNGTLNDPYQIATVEDFYLLSESPADWSKHFILTADIDLSDTIFDASPIAPDRDNISCGFQWTSFSGTFEGNGYVIKNLKIEAPEQDYVGLFGRLAVGQIRNLRIENADIHGRSYVGALVGANWYGTVDNCQTTGSVNGTDYVGGLAGYNIRGTLTSCDGCCIVEGSSSVGGIAGENGSGTIVNCLATNPVNVSGLSTYSYAGGLTGCNKGTIQSSYSEANVSAAGNNVCIGGIAGVQYSGNITSAYSTGSVSGDGISSNYSGGFTGYLSDGSVNYSYSTSAVTAKGESGYMGGFSGETDKEADIHSCFWDIESSGLNYSSGGKGVNSQLMKSLTIFQNAGWADKGWIIEDGVDSPRLEWENVSGGPIPPAEIYLEGSGIYKDPYLIYTAEEFASLSWQEGILNKRLKLMNDLDLSNVPLFPIGDLGAFTGIFDGNGHTLYNVKIHQPGSDYVGLFGKVENGCYILNLEVIGADICGNDYVGALAGASIGGSVVLCSCSGSIEATGWYAGGLTGWFTEKTYWPKTGPSGERASYMTASCSACEVIGTEDVGGLIGHIQSHAYWSYIDNCYARGPVKGTHNVGGFAGVNDKGKISYCYATGPVFGTDSSVGGLIGKNLINRHYNPVTSCFWDTQASEQSKGVGEGPDGDGITGKTTDEMKTRSTFADAGWAISETSNGDNGFWLTYEGVHYPKLWWQQHHLVADAGQDITAYAWMDGIAAVNLDGTQSYDEDLDELEYFWYNDANELIAEGGEPNVLFETGEYEVALIVSDGIENSEPNSCTVTVIGPLETDAKLIPQTLNRKSKRPAVIGRLKFAGETMPLLDPNEPMLLITDSYELRAERQNLVYSEENTAWYLVGFFDNAALMDAVPNGNTDITLAAKLESGQWTYGTDTIRVK